jgi:hypothetical protein
VDMSKTLANYQLSLVQVIPAILIALIIETREIMGSSKWKLNKSKKLRGFQSYLWFVSIAWLALIEVILLWNLSHALVDEEFLKRIWLPVSVSLLAIAGPVLIEIFIRTNDLTIVFLQIHFNAQYRRCLQVIWERNISPTRILERRKVIRAEIHLKDMQAKLEILKSRIQTDEYVELETPLDSYSKEITETRAWVDSKRLFEEETFRKDYLRKRMLEKIKEFNRNW